MSVTYCANADFLTGDITFPDGEYDKYRSVAFDEINAKLGFKYVVPVVTSGHSAIILKVIESRLASGRLILARAASGEDTNLQAYGASLVAEAMVDMGLIISGAILLDAEEVAGATASGNAPSIIQGDATSGVDAFYGWLNAPPFFGMRFPSDGYW